MHPQIAYLANAPESINRIFYLVRLDSNIEPDVSLDNRASSKTVSCMSVLMFVLVHIVHVLLLVVLYSAC